MPTANAPSESVRVPRLRALIAVALAMATVVAPGAFGSAFAGPPLGEIARWILVAGLFTSVCVAVLRPRHALPLTVIAALAGLLGVQVWIGTTAEPGGWRGTYVLLDEPQAEAQFAWRYAVHPYRIDRAIEFSGSSAGLHFLNDLGRYGAAISPDMREVSVPLRITWDGVAYLPEGGPVTVRITGRGAVSVTVNGSPLISNPGPDASEFATSGPLPVGHVNLSIVYQKPSGIAPALIVRAVSPISGQLDVRPFHKDTPVPPLPTLDWSLAIVMTSVGMLLAALLWACDAAYLAGQARRAPGRAAGTLALLLAFGTVLYLAGRDAVPFLNTTFHLWSGDDPLAYVGNARNILLEGWLMPAGRPLGSGEPYYVYPLFPYVVGLAHWVVGEDFAVVRLVNGWAVAAVLPLCWALAWHGMRWWAAIAGIGAMAWLIVRHMLPYALIGYTDSLFTGIVFLALVCCRQAITARGWWPPVAGFVCAMAAATRPSFLTFTPLFVVALLATWRSVPFAARARVAGGVLAGFLVGLAPFGVRNLIVAGKFVVLVSSWIQLPYFLVPPEVTPNPVPAMFSTAPSLPESLLTVGRMFFDDPTGVVRLELRKVAFTFGMTDWGMPGGSTRHPELLLLSALFVAVLVRRRLPLPLGIVVCTFALSHVIAMVMAAPWTYGYKTILPLHAVFLVSACYLLPGAVAASGVQPTERGPHVARP